MLLYGYCIGVRSSRQIERRCQEDVAFRVLAGNRAPDHVTIARFRVRHEQALAGFLVQSLRLCAAAGMVRVGTLALDGRPMPPVEAFLRQSQAVLGHDAAAQLGRITAPTQVTVGRHDLVCSTRFIDALTGGIADTELVVFEDCSHAPIYENVPDFNAQTLAFLQRHSG